MKRHVALLSALLFSAAAFSHTAAAATFNFTFAGPGVSGAVTLTYGAGTDLNNGLNIFNTPILSLVPLNRQAPDPDNLLAPADFSRFPVAAGLPMENNNSLSYDNLYYPGGSPQTASDYPIRGGFLDIYGLLFNIGGGRTVNFWSNGDFTQTGMGPIQYGVAVATPQQALDYVGGVSITPEPGAFSLLGTGLAGMFAWRRFRSRRHAA